jgi:hypothetical protein
MNIKINPNSDCAGELDALNALLKQNKKYTFCDFTNAQIVEIAVNELYDKLVDEKKRGENQRRGV